MLIINRYRIIAFIFLFCSVSGYANFNLGDAEILKMPVIQLNDLLVFQTEINGEKGNFVLDTGADAIILNQNVSLNGKLQPSQFVSVAGDVESKKMVVETFVFSKIVNKNVEVYLSDLKSIEEFLKIPIMGVVGANWFMPNTVNLDLEKKSLSILKQGLYINTYDDFKKIKFSLEYGVPLVDVKIGRKNYRFLFDSAASCSLVDKKLVRRHKKHFDKKGEIINLVTASQRQIELKSTKLNSLKIDGVGLCNIKLLISDFDEINENLNHEIHGLLSWTDLNSIQIILDYQSSTLYFK